MLLALSSENEAYARSAAGFEKEWGGPVPAVNLERESAARPRGARIVVAFGSKAALLPYPDGVTLLYWAPGLGAEELDRTGPAVKISMGARPAALAAQLKEIQPELKNLRIFYIAGYYARYIEELRRAAPELTIEADRLDSPDKLPERIRAMRAKPDAVLLLNDPLLINPHTFMILKNYSESSFSSA